MKKRLLSMLLVFVMLLSILPVGAWAATGRTYTDATAAQIDTGVTATKKRTDNQDGTYTITLSVTGTTDTSSETTSLPADIALIIDSSGSMDYCGGTYEERGAFIPYLKCNRCGNVPIFATAGDICEIEDTDKDRMDYAQAAATTFVTNMLKHEDVRIGLADFSGGNWLKDSSSGGGNRQHVALTRDVNSLTNAINTLDKDHSDGTNYAAGLRAAEEILKDSNASQKFVVFISDGEPNEYYTQPSEYYADYQGKTAFQALAAKGITVITVGIDMKDDSELEKVSSEDSEGNKYCYSDGADALQTVLDGIQKIIESTINAGANAVMTDIINSDSFELVTDSASDNLTVAENTLTWDIGDITSETKTASFEVKLKADNTMDGELHTNQNVTLTFDSSKLGERVTFTKDAIGDPTLNVYKVTYTDGASGTAFEDQVTYNLISGAETPSFRGTPTRVGYDFAGWDNDIAKTVTKSVTYTAQWTPKSNTAYKVEHYQQNLDGTYPEKPTDTDEMTGTTDAAVTAEPKSYPGFTENTTYADRVPSGNIAADGNLVLKLYYDRNTYTVTYELAGGSTTSEQTTFTNVRYGAGTPTITDPTCDGYVFAGWDKDIAGTVTANATYTARWDVDENKDGIADKYQVFVNFVSADENGTVTNKAYEEGNEPTTPHGISQVYTFENHATSGTVTPTLDGVETKPYSNYAFDIWAKGSDNTTAVNPAAKLENVQGGTTITFYAHFAEDKIGGKDGGDGTPDKYQRTVTYKIVNGTWDQDGQDVAPKVYVFTLKTKNDTTGEWDLVNPAPILGKTIPTGMKPDADYSKSNGYWGENDEGTDDPTEDTVVENNATYTYTYGTRNSYSITVDVTGGTAVPADTSITVSHGAGQSIAFTPNKGYILDSVTVDGTSAALTNNAYVFSNVVEDHTINVVYKLDVKGNPDENGNERGDGIADEYQVFVKYVAGNGGSLTGETYKAYDLRQADPAGRVELTFPTPVANSGYEFNDWTNPSGVIVTGSTMTGFTSGTTYTFTANFAEKRNPVVPTYTVTLHKYDADTNESLQGAKFELYKKQGTTWVKYQLSNNSTNAEGKLTVHLTPGTYYFVEVTAPAGYLLDTAHYEFTVTNKPVTIEVPNTRSTVPDGFTKEHYAYIVGYPDGTVQPNGNITRAEVATIFFRLLDEDTRSANLSTTNSFSDVSEGMWFNTAISTLEKMGILNGYQDGTFRPNEKITRAELVKIAASFEDVEATSENPFTDTNNHWAKAYIDLATENGWINGYEDNTFKPNQPITRAETMAVVNRVLQRLPKSVDDLLPDMITWPDNMDETAWYYLYVQEATNSHDYNRVNGLEKWTQLKETPDWTMYEK